MRRTPSRRALHRYAVLTAVATCVLLIAGGLVTSTGSGLAVPDWPLSYGTWWPRMEGGVAYEHGHRVMAAGVALLIFVLTVWLGIVERRRWMRWLGLAAFGGVVLQALLGGATVLLHLPPAVSIAHALLAQTVFCLTVCVAWGTRRAFEESSPPLEAVGTRTMRGWALATASLAAAQLLLGAIIRHTGSAVFVHIGNAFALVASAACLAALLLRVREQTPMLWRSGMRLVFLVTAQIVVGLLVFTHRGAITLRTTHVVLGALVLAQAVVLAWEVVRRRGLPAFTRGPHVVSVGADG